MVGEKFQDYRVTITGKCIFEISSPFFGMFWSLVPYVEQYPPINLRK